jgi:serine/threonine-protein kinase HipA
MRPERRLEVTIGGRRAGILHAREDYSWFSIDPDYGRDPSRAVLGLRFEQDLRARHSSNMRLPPWFSNLLPEGRLREWISHHGRVSSEREFELLKQVGHDLPGAVRIVPTEEHLDGSLERETSSKIRAERSSTRWRFSLAGIQMKFSMLARGERFTAPAVGEDGDWIVKLPDGKFPRVPENEFLMMTLARHAGLDVPDVKLVHRDLIDEVPTDLWPSGEEYAFAVRRFDRAPGGRRVHIEDFAQVRGFYPEDKYSGTFETVLGLCYRGRDSGSLAEGVRRIAFNVCIRNGDAHLKNWSLIYRNARIPRLSPAYDLVCTSIYPGVDNDLGLRLCGTRRFDRISNRSFAEVGRHFRSIDLDLGEEARDTALRIRAELPGVLGLARDGGLARMIEDVVRIGTTHLSG